MSKKRRNRANQSEHITLGLTTSTNNQTIVNDAIEKIDKTQASESTRLDESNKVGLLAYVRNPSHWWIIGLIALFTLGAMGAGLKYLEEAAQKERAGNNLSANNRQNKSFLSSLNPFAASPVVTSTPLPLSKEYIYAGSRMLAVVDDGADAEPPADLAYWRPSSGTWYVMGGTGSMQVSQQWGANADTPVPGDYDGDGKTDFAVFRPGDANWYIIMSSNTTYVQFAFGTGTDKPVPADYDGDGKTDPAVFNPSTLVWQIRPSSTNTPVTPSLSFTLQTGDVPAPADYDGDGKADVAVFRPLYGTWHMQRSTLGYEAFPYGLNGDTPLPADYDGDGKADHAVRRGNAWYINQSSNGATQTTTWELATDTPVQNDYDGDGKVDIAVWRSGSRGTWYIKNSSTGLLRKVIWGTTGDVPVPAFYRR